jgi:hypothetical protein
MRIAILAVGMVGVMTPAAHAQTYVRAGTEGGAVVAVNQRLRPVDGIVQGEVVLVPRTSSGRTSYAVLIADYDCERQTRSVRARTEYSSNHDPVQIDFDPPRVTGVGERSLAEQLRIMCRATGDEDRYTIEELVHTRAASARR